LGCRTKSVNGYPPVQINGRIQGGIVKIPGDISSQFISGLLIACPYATQDTEIVLTSDLVSKPYVDLTLECVKKFEGEIKNLYYEQFFIPGEQCYRSKRYDVEGDWSSGSFLLAAGVIAGQVTVKNLNLNSKQGDRAILDILKQMGAEISVDVGITAKKSELKGIEIDAKNFPDLVPVLAILGCYAKGETIIKNVEHARLKECDRIRASYTELRKMGANIEEKKDGLIVRESKLKGTILDSYKDHRMVLALSVGALGAEGETIIKDAEVVDVSFPNFVNIMQKLGANIK
jgi:3-phosphoshikimate 1-carboxyvinyltransferase